MPAFASSGASGRRRVLVVDDNHDAADTLAVLLEFLDCEAAVAYDGRQAVDIATEFRPDLVILDINMPVMDGYEAARHLKLLNTGQRLVLVALTALAEPVDQVMARAAGFDVHLTKPVAGEELGKVLKAAFARPSGPEEVFVTIT